MWQVEYTDTFGGEANYCWVKRAEFTKTKNENQTSIMRKAKALVGLTGVRGKTIGYGDSYEFRPYHMATVLFVTYN